jgi:hypothetical protein
MEEKRRESRFIQTHGKKYSGDPDDKGFTFSAQ